MINTSKMKRSLTMGLLGTAFIFSPLAAISSDDHSEVCVNCGVVLSVQEVATSSTGMGAAAGAVAGGLAGNQVDASTTSTLIGAAVGVIGGHIAEQTMAGSGWTVTLKMDQGAPRTLNMQDKPSVKPGDRVQIQGSNLVFVKAEHGDDDASAKHEDASEKHEE